MNQAPSSTRPVTYDVRKFNQPAAAAEEIERLKKAGKFWKDHAVNLECLVTSLKESNGAMALEAREATRSNDSLKTQLAIALAELESLRADNKRLERKIRLDKPSQAAKASRTRRELVLEDGLKNCVKTDVQSLIDIICGYFDVTIDQFFSRSRKAAYIMPRQMVCFFAANMVKLSLEDIAFEITGTRDHSYVIYGRDKIKNAGDDKSVAYHVEQITNLLKSC